MDDNGQQADCSFAFMTSLAASGPWTMQNNSHNNNNINNNNGGGNNNNWPFQAPQTQTKQLQLQAHISQPTIKETVQTSSLRQDMQILSASPQQQQFQVQQLQIQQQQQQQQAQQQQQSQFLQLNPLAMKDSSLMVLSMQTHSHRSCTTSPSPSPSPNSCLASTLSFNFPSTPTSCSSYSTPASSSTTNPSNRRPRPPSLNIPPLCLSLSAFNSNDSNSPTASATSFASLSASSFSADSDVPGNLEGGGTALPLLLEALDPQLWPITQLTSSSLGSAVSTDSSALSSPSTNSIDSFQSLTADIVQSSGPNIDTQSLSTSNAHSVTPQSPQMPMSLSITDTSSMSAVNPIALSIAVTQALQQIPSSALVSTPCSYNSFASFSNSTSVSPSASTSTSQSTSSTSSPQLPLRMLISDADASPNADSTASLFSMSSSALASDADSVTFLQNREAAAAFLRCMPFPTPKRRSTIHTCSPAAAAIQPHQIQPRPNKAAKLDNTGAITDRSRQTVVSNNNNTPNKSEKLPMHLPVPLQAWQCPVPTPAQLTAMDSQPTNSNGTANGNSSAAGGNGVESVWHVAPLSRNNWVVSLPSSSVVNSIGAPRSVSPQPLPRPQSLLVLQPHPQHFYAHSNSQSQSQSQAHSHGHGHGHSASTGSRLGGSLVVNSKRMKHPVAGEAPLA